MSIRVGLHHGPAILEAGDVFGDAVNVAARMASMSKSGQIITTQTTVEELPPILKASTRFIDRAPVKGKKDTMDIFEGVDHGYAFVERAPYDPEAAEVSWEKTFDLFARTLR